MILTLLLDVKTLGAINLQHLRKALTRVLKSLKLSQKTVPCGYSNT